MIGAIGAQVCMQSVQWVSNSGLPCAINLFTIDGTFCARKVEDKYHITVVITVLCDVACCDMTLGIKGGRRWKKST